MSEVIVLSREQYVADMELAAMRGAELAFRKLNAKEKPLPRKELMKELGIKDVRTFNRRVQILGIRARGTYGSHNEPMYMLSDFYK